MEAKSPIFTGKPLATVKEDLRYARLAARRMFIVTTVCGLIIAAAAQLHLSETVTTLLIGAAFIAFVIGLTTAIGLVIQFLKILLNRRSMLEIYEDGFRWKVSRSVLHRSANQAAYGFELLMPVSVLLVGRLHRSPSGNEKHYC